MPGSRVLVLALLPLVTGQSTDLTAYEHALNDIPTPASLRAWHDLFGSEPHVAGTPGDLRNIERLADAFERMGLPGRPWFRNLYAATDPDSGYAAWMLPGLRYSIEQRDPAGLAEAQRLCVAALGSLSRIMDSLDDQLGP